MKKLLYIFTLLLIANHSFADCEISYIASDRLDNAIKQKGFVFENYEDVCKKLSTFDATIHVSDVSVVTPTNVVGAVTISLTPTVRNGFQQLRFNTANAVSSLAFSKDRTSNGETQALYDALMSGLEYWGNNPKSFRDAFQKLDELRIMTRY